MLPERVLAICKECHSYYKAKVECMSTMLFFFFYFLSLWLCRGGMLIRRVRSASDQQGGTDSSLDVCLC